MDKIKVGIFFGGSSREREISFAGGRTVYDNLDKGIFEAIPIFVDSKHQLAVLDWEYIYKGTIRDFYPPIHKIPKSKYGFQIYLESLPEADSKDLINAVGQHITLEDLTSLIDVAFLALHGSGGEDGQLQGLLEFLRIPYTGSGIFPSAIGINKSIQKEWMKMADYDVPDSFVITKDEWQDQAACFQKAKKEIGFPLVIRPANQGSSIGVSVVKEADSKTFAKAINLGFFEYSLSKEEWKNASEAERIQITTTLGDIKEGLGFPLYLEGKIIYHPDELHEKIDDLLDEQNIIILKAEQSENEVLIESFIDGREFSCIVMRKEDGTCVALPPTEIIIGQEVYDYRSKYLPGLSRKLTPIDLSVAEIEDIQKECIRLFELFRFDTYARIDGFYTAEKKIFLNDPNTTSGMMPSSFFFHQAAELGLNPSQFLSYIVRMSMQERLSDGMPGEKMNPLITRMDEYYADKHKEGVQKKKVAVIFGGYSSERHISVESGRNIYEKLASSEKYDPVPIFLMGDADDFKLYQIPINLVLKDNADDIRDKISNYQVHPLVENLRLNHRDILDKYVGTGSIEEPINISLPTLGQKVDSVFIALHGRPGEDGTLQAKLLEHNIPFNGSQPSSSTITIDKYKTLQLLKEHGFIVAKQHLIFKGAYANDPLAVKNEILAEFDYPFIMKPVDDGCSSAVCIIKNESYLDNYLKGIFREDDKEQAWRDALNLKYNEEFPFKDHVLIEELIEANGAEQFMEITGGLLTHRKGNEVSYELFEPSEALSSGDILSLEEKFLAGQGQNITPARFSTKTLGYKEIAEKVKADLKRAAEILGITGYARIDAFVRIFADGKVETIIIEANSLPGMTPATCIFHQCAINGYKPYEFIDEILTFAEGNKMKKQLV